MKRVEEFWIREDPENTYEESNIDEWYFGKEDMINFAERYAQQYYQAKAKDLLERAAERAELLINGINATASNIKVDKQSITETPLER